jgi:hypothetical protein
LLTLLVTLVNQNLKFWKEKQINNFMVRLFHRRFFKSIYLCRVLSFKRNFIFRQNLSQRTMYTYLNRIQDRLQGSMLRSLFLAISTIFGKSIGDFIAINLMIVFLGCMCVESKASTFPPSFFLRKYLTSWILLWAIVLSHKICTVLEDGVCAKIACLAGLPDFYSVQHSKTGKIYPKIATTSIAWPSKFTQNEIFGLKIDHLATLLPSFFLIENLLKTILLNQGCQMVSFQNQKSQFV